MKVEVYEEELKVTPGYADARGLFGIPDTFRAFMDMAAIHAEVLGLGFRALAAKDMFWLTVKTSVHFVKRPKMCEGVTLRTWPEKPERARGNRSYEMVLNGERAAFGKTEWAVVNVKTNRLCPMAAVYPEDMVFPEGSACPEPYAKVDDCFEEGDYICDHRVVSSDIDVGGHMNNAAYVKALFSGFTNAQLSGMDIARMDVIFRAPCFEGDVLKVFRRRDEEGFSLKMEREGKPAILAKMFLR
ncbi:MAG: hypothetical protein J6P98_00420 [Clostridia bacterium]|nr:hypothetical protein [Clostridia bacterium]